MNLSEIIVYLLVAGAVFYISQRMYRSLSKKDCNKGCGCSGDLAKTKH